MIINNNTRECMKDIDINNTVHIIENDIIYIYPDFDDCK